MCNIVILLLTVTKFKFGIFVEVSSQSLMVFLSSPVVEEIESSHSLLSLSSFINLEGPQMEYDVFSLHLL